MWMKHRSVFQDPVKYIQNDILKPFRVDIIRYDELDCLMHNLAKYVPPRSIKGDDYDKIDWKFCDKEFSEYDISV